VTRVLITRHPGRPDSAHGHGADQGLATDLDPGADLDPSAPVGLQGRLRAAMALLPPTLGGAPSQPLEVGRATRVVQPAQRMALAVRGPGLCLPGL
jgi:hypothetical protein